ncbi:hypothetical protein MTYP_01163 [Methylophilaceae bacterium]|nr:hypothetical protein MTYP_01163 [Methylophilaceae bacterium]
MANSKEIIFRPCPLTHIAVVAFALCLTCTGARAQSAPVLKKENRFELFADTRLRLESDFDSVDESGQAREDRDRIRLRARLGARYKFSERFTAQARARTGPKFSQQSTNITLLDLNGNGADDFSVVMDQWFIQGKSGHIEGWLGRNTFPFWRQNNNEMFWNDNATIAGSYLQFGLHETQGTQIQLRAGYFVLPDGAIDFSGQLAAAQLVLGHRLNEDWKMTAGAGYFHMNSSGNAEYLIDGNGNRDYRIGIASIQAERSIQPGPFDANFIRLGADLIRNFSNYSSKDSDPVTAEFSEAKDGFTVSTVLGSTITDAEGTGRWQVTYMYAYIEKLAINSAYAQSNWVRWGANRQSDVSNLKGHEVGFRYWINKNVDINNRLFVVDSLTTPQDGNRFRVDLNIRF